MTSKIREFVEVQQEINTAISNMVEEQAKTLESHNFTLATHNAHLEEINKALITVSELVKEMTIRLSAVEEYLELKERLRTH